MAKRKTAVPAKIAKPQPKMDVTKFDASLLQFVPKGSYYNTEDEQLASIEKVWTNFLKTDRTIFSLSTLLPGTVYAKGRMTHLLLSTAPKKEDKDIQKYQLPENFETAIILWNLRNEKDMAKVLKNLLMLAGIRKEDKSYLLKRVNNARTKRVILDYIFNRDNSSLESMSIKFKNKIVALVRHALGIQDLTKLLHGNAAAEKKITRYNADALPVVHFLFNSKMKSGNVSKHFEKIEIYRSAQEAAKKKDVEVFKKILDKKVLPFETMLGFRNTFKLEIDKAVFYEKGQMSEKQKLQSKSAAKTAGTDIKVNYNSQDIYDLWKLFYVNVIRGETADLDKIAASIQAQSKKSLGIELGDVVVIFDASKSMEGSETRPYHPFLTGLSLISKLDNIKDVIYVGGHRVKTGSGTIPQIMMPSGSTEIWKALIKAAESKPQTVLVISDGYENSIKGAFDHVYQQLKADGHTFNLIHINPVFAAEVSGLRPLSKDAKPMALDNYKFLKTNLVFELITKDQHLVKKMLTDEFKKLIQGGKNNG